MISEKVFIDTTFYDERIDYYEDARGVPSCEKYKGFGSIEFWLDGSALRWTMDFWRNAKQWYIKKEQERILKETKENK